MPFASKAQRAYLHTRHPEIAKRWEAHTPKSANLPARVGRPATRGLRDAAKVKS